MVAAAGTKYQEQKLRAAEIFVDREKPRDLFIERAREFASQTPRQFKLLGFHGAGGQGKTALCGALQRMLGQDPLKGLRFASAFIDLHANRPGDYIHALVSLRNALALGTGMPFACFDLALVDYHDQLGILRPHMTIGAAKLHGFATDLKEGAGEQLYEGAKAGVGEIFSEAVGGLPFVGPSLKRMAKWGIEKGAEAYLRSHSPVLEALYQRPAPPTPQIIRLHLADILAHELALWMRKHPKRPVLLFIDEYENVLPAGGSKFQVFSSSEWDEALRNFISACATGRYEAAKPARSYDYQAGFLLLIFGREKLRWDRIDPAWASEMTDQHLLGGLSEADALDFLQQAKIEEPEIRTAIVAAATAPDQHNSAVAAAYPIMLDLGVQIYFDIKARGRVPAPADFTADGASYAERRRSLLHRYLRNFSQHEGLEALLRRLACVREFDLTLVADLADRFAPAFDLSYFEDLTALSFVSQAEDGANWVIHNHIRDALLDSLSAKNTAETHAWLAAWFLKQGTPASTREMCVSHAEHIGDAVVHHAHAKLPLTSVREGTRRQVLNWAAAQPFLRRSCQRAVEILRKDLSGQELILGQSLGLLAGTYLSERKAEEARPFAEEAFAIRQRVLPSDHLDLAMSLRDMGLVAFFEDDFKAAIGYFQRAYDIRTAQLPPGDRAIFISLHDLALSYRRAGQHEDSRRLFAEALTVSKLLSPDAESEVAHLLYNMAYYQFEENAPEEASEMAEQSLRIRQATLPEGHADIGETQTLLGQIYLQLGNHERGASLLTAALIQEQRSESPQADRTAGLAHLLIQSRAALRRQGKTTDGVTPGRLPPLYHGPWQNPITSVEKAIRDKLDKIPVLDEGREIASFGHEFAPHDFRCLALPFWGDDWLLFEAQVEPAAVVGLWDGREIILDYGLSYPIHKRNESGIDLSTPELRLAYLRFFCSWVRGEDGRFALICDPEDLSPFVPAQGERQTLYSVAAAHCEIERSTEDGWRLSIPLVYGDALFRGNLLLKPSGETEMLSDEPIDTDGIAIHREIWAGPFRLSDFALG